MQLEGSVAFVTGAGRGIGRAIALGLAQAGADLAVATLDAPEVAGIERELRGLGRQVLALQADVSQEADVERVVAAALARFGRIDLLVNNAGTIVLPGDVLGMTVEAWERTMAVNVRSVFLASRAVLPGMLERRRGKIVNIASTAGLRGLRERAAYCASKHAVVGFTKALALDVKPYGIAVNAVCPGAVETALTDYTRPDADKRDWLQPPDIADVVLFLASDAARGMTGALLEVAGWID